MSGGVRNDGSKPDKNCILSKEDGGKDWAVDPAHWERLTLFWEISKHPQGGGRMWKIIKEHVKSPEGVRESMLRVKAHLQGRKLKNLGWITEW